MEGQAMAKKNKPADATEKGDRHRSTKLVRIGDDVHGSLSQLAKRNDRPLTWELRRILIAALKKEGLWPEADE
jgi:hypothetical protein